MGDSTQVADAALASVDGMDSSPGIRLRRWLRVAGGEGKDATASEQLAELEREVTLLREENARLKVAREHAGDRPVNERVRAALPRREEDPDGDEPWEILTECMLLRDGLVDACRELERGARELRGRLETLLPNAEGAGDDARPSKDFEGVV
jgi:hypothetical protein